MSAVVLPAAISHFTSTQVIFSNSTRSVCAHGAARAGPAARIREAVPQAINISKECETEPMRMAFSFLQKHKLPALSKRAIPGFSKSKRGAHTPWLKTAVMDLLTERARSAFLECSGHAES